jgi:hypothetical protein
MFQLRLATVSEIESGCETDESQETENDLDEETDNTF